MDNMRHVLPGSTRHQRRTIARKVIRNHLKNYYDLVRLPHLKREDIERMVVPEGVENIETALGQGKGVIVFSGHLGNFAIVAQLAVIRGYDVSVVAEDIKPEKLYDYINKLRTGFGVKFVRTGSSQIRTVYRLLRSNGVLMLAADRDVTGGGVPVQFFDAPADLPAGPVVLALRLKAPLIPAYTIRLKNDKSVVFIGAPMELERTGDHDHDIQVNLRKVTEYLETAIRKHPDQWLVLQKVWDREYTVSDSGGDRLPLTPDRKEEDLAPSLVAER
jgi:KDO2-lipid IV(A) lauroyltransferase